jgi:hypothetical protein
MGTLSHLYFEILDEVEGLVSCPSYSKYQDAKLARNIDNQILRLRMWASHVETRKVRLLEALENDTTATNLVSITRANFEYILELVRCIAKPEDGYEDILEQLEERLDCLYVIKYAVDDVENKDQIKQFHKESLARAEHIPLSGARKTPETSAQQTPLDLLSARDTVALQDPSADHQNAPKRIIRESFDQSWAFIVPKDDSTSTMLDWNRAESISTTSFTTGHHTSTSRASTITSPSSYGQDSDSEDEMQDFTFRTSKPSPFDMSTDAATPRKDNFTMPDIRRSHESDWFKNLEDTAIDELCAWYLRWNFDPVAFSFDQLCLSDEESVDYWRWRPVQPRVSA